MKKSLMALLVALASLAGLVSGGPRGVGAAGTDLDMLRTPCRVYDSQRAVGELRRVFVGGETRTIQITGDVTGQGGIRSQCVPEGANAVLAVVGVRDAQAEGNLIVGPAAGGSVPGGGVVNYAANGLDNTNTVTIPLSADGAIEVTANGGPAGVGLPSTDVRVTVLGYYGLGSLRYFPLTPCAAADSRTSQGAAGTFVGPLFSLQKTPAIDVVGTFSADQGGGNTTCGVPEGVLGVVVNLVAVNATGRGSLAVLAFDRFTSESQTAFANLGMNNASLAYVALDGGQRVQVANSPREGFPSTHYRLVVVGYLDDAEGGDVYTPASPCAVFDSRVSQGATGAFAGPRDGGSTTTYQVRGGAIPVGQGGGHGGSCGVPNAATAVLINLVAVNPATAGNLQAAAAGTAPTGGLLNFAALVPAMNNSNAVVVPLSATGQIAVTVNTGATNVVDAVEVRGVVLGYYS